jgi:hypothetical protein
MTRHPENSPGSDAAQDRTPDGILGVRPRSVLVGHPELVLTKAGLLNTIVRGLTGQLPGTGLARCMAAA